MGLRFCYACDGETLEGASVDRSGAVAVCSACGTPYPKTAPDVSAHAGVAQTVEQPSRKGPRVGSTPTAGSDDDDEPIVVQYTLPGVPAPAPAPREKQAKAAPAPRGSEPRDALRDVRARRRAIRGEIKRLRALEAEDRELAAAEHAIEAARRADVTPIRSAK